MKKFIFKLQPYNLTILGGQNLCKSNIYMVVTYSVLSYNLSYNQVTTVTYQTFIDLWNVLKINILRAFVRL